MAFLLSLIFPGAGQVYCSAVAAGSVLLLLRIVSLLLLPLQGTHFLAALMAIILLNIFISLYGALWALFQARKGNRHPLKRPGLALSLFVGANIIFTALALGPAWRSFSLISPEEGAPPSFGKGSLLVVSHIKGAKFGDGDMVLLKDGSVGRIIVRGPARVSSHRGTISVSGKVLSLSSLAEDRVLSLPPSLRQDVVAEHNGSRSYAVLLPDRKSRRSKPARHILKVNRFLIAPDDRRQGKPLLYAGQEEIMGTVEGALIPASFRYPVFLPFL